MDEKKFLEKCKKEIRKYTNITLDHALVSKEYDIYVVWCCKTLQNNKALLATTLPDDMYYECTYNGDRNEMYLDAYKKRSNITIKMD